MGHPIHGKSSRFTNRLKFRSAMLVGVVILGGVAISAEDRPKRRSGRKPAAAAAKDSGLPPTQNFNRDVPEPPYAPFFPNSSAHDEELVFQKEVARILCQQAQSYPGREEHFGWLANDALFQAAVHRVYGLNGYILEAKAVPGGGWLARVSVRPSVAAIGLAEIEDFILEDYQYKNGVLTLIQTDASVPKPDKHVLRLH